MNEPTLDTLNQRIDRLEWEVRKWKVMGSVAVAVLTFILFAGALRVPVPEEIRARRFVVVDEQNERRGYLGMSPLGGDVTVLYLFDKGEKTGIKMRVVPNDSAALFLIAEERSVRGELWANANGSTYLNLLRPEWREKGWTRSKMVLSGDELIIHADGKGVRIAP